MSLGPTLTQKSLLGLWGVLQGGVPESQAFMWDLLSAAPLARALSRLGTEKDTNLAMTQHTIG